MAYLTETKLQNVLDIPVSLSATEIMQGDWLIVASTKVVSPMVLTVRYLSLQLLSSNIDTTRISSVNYVYGNLGLVYLVLRRDYTTGNPGATGALETLIATSTGIFTRDTASPLVISTPGIYSWIAVNNMKADATSLISTSTSIDFRLCITGQARIDLSNA